jgi:hypothetical protein
MLMSHIGWLITEKKNKYPDSPIGAEGYAEKYLTDLAMPAIA